MAKVTTTSNKSEILPDYEKVLEQLKQERKERTALHQEVEKKNKHFIIHPA